MKKTKIENDKEKNKGDNKSPSTSFWSRLPRIYATKVDSEFNQLSKADQERIQTVITMGFGE